MGQIEDYIGVLCLVAIAALLWLFWYYCPARWPAIVYRFWRAASLYFAIYGVVALLVLGAWAPIDYWTLQDVPHKEVTLQMPGTERPFFAVDRKCASEYQDSMQASGFEAKERLEKILSVCGAFIDNGASAVLLERQSGMFKVRIKAGRQGGSVGWVPERAIMTAVSSSDPHRQ
jgi:hypothetical protein